MSKIDFPYRWTPGNGFGLAIPLGIYAIFIASAYLIGDEHSCEPVANFYWWGGYVSLPVLFSVPFIFARNLHIALRVISGLISTTLGIVIWAWAHDAAGMRWICRLF